MTIDDYVNAAKEYINYVIIVGDTISSMEQVVYVLIGLDVTYTFL